MVVISHENTQVQTFVVLKVSGVFFFLVLYSNHQAHVGDNLKIVHGKIAPEETELQYVMFLKGGPH